MRFLPATLLGFVLSLSIPDARAEAVKLDAVLSTSESISLAFKNDDRRFVTLLKREGTASGSGIFKGAQVVEYGMHDVIAGDTAEAAGYLEATTQGGDAAYFKWQLRATFVQGPEGKTRVVNAGTWEIIGGTGRFADQRGVGSLRIEFPSKTERRYIFEGDISPSP
mgnify:FL=1